MRLGAHLPVRGGLVSVIPTAREIEAETVQVFLSNPRGWAPPTIADERAAAFREAWAGSGLGPLFAHAPYLVNVASPNPRFLSRSLDLAGRTLAACDAIGAQALVVHAGSGRGSDTREAIDRAAAVLGTLARAGSEAGLLVEPMAGTAGSVASTLPEIVRLFEAVDDERLGLCLDTCHLFVAGYRLDEPDGVDAFFEELDTSGLLTRLALVHANDAKYPRGSRRDRHQTIGEGLIGLAGFRAILRRPELAEVSVVLETPGGPASYREELHQLRGLLRE